MTQRKRPRHFLFPDANTGAGDQQPEAAEQPATEPPPAMVMGPGEPARHPRARRTAQGRAVPPAARAPAATPAARAPAAAPAARTHPIPTREHVTQAAQEALQTATEQSRELGPILNARQSAEDAERHADAITRAMKTARGYVSRLDGETFDLEQGIVALRSRLSELTSNVVGLEQASEALNARIAKHHAAELERRHEEPRNEDDGAAGGDSSSSG